MNKGSVTFIGHLYRTEGANRLLDDEYYQYDEMGRLEAKLVGVVNGSTIIKWDAHIFAELKMCASLFSFLTAYPVWMG